MAGFLTADKTGVYAYMTTATVTTVTTGNVFVPVLGTFTNAPMDGFHLDGDKIICDCPSGTMVEMDWHTSFSSQDATRTIHFGISINEEVLTVNQKGVVGTFAKNLGQVYNVSGTLVLQLNYGDSIQLQTTSDTAADQITVEHFSTTIAKFYRGN